jgi:hypothetical protein
MRRYIIAMFAGVAALIGLTFMGAATAQAAEVTAGSTVAPLTNPPGSCRSDEVGDWKMDNHGAIYYCTYIPGEGYYWIPL